MTYKFIENDYENAIIELFQQELGYSYQFGPDISREYNQVILESEFKMHLTRINPQACKAAVNEAVRKVLLTESPNLIENNKTFHQYLVNGIDVDYYQEGPKSTHLWLIDYKNISLNDFVICNQYSVEDREVKRPDLVIFINGLPLVVMELKSCSREQADTSSAYKQIRNYLQAIPSLFTYNAFCVISDMTETKAGTITASEDRFMRWKSVDGTEEETRSIDFETFFKGMFQKQRLLNLLKNFILFLGDKDEEPVKILSAYHQFYAVNKALHSTLNAVETNGKAGVFWHTQGSGKSLSMVFYAAMLAEPLHNPTLVLLTDRNDLDDQLFTTFSKAADHLRQIPVRAGSRRNLKDLLDGRKAGGIIFTTIQKFEEGTEALSNRKNIIMIADEAHRSQYGLNAKVDRESGKISYGMAKYIRDALPNASFIGFTGTPIDSADRSTQEIFGDYIDVYDMTQAVEDEATRPIYYESRVMNLRLEEHILSRIDKEYEKMAIEAEPHHIARSQREMGNMEAILGAPETIKELCKDIAGHYSDRKNMLAGKAMVVAYSRSIGIKIYRQFLKMYPHWKNKLAIVMSKDNNDPEEWFELIPDKKDRDDLGIKFKNPESELKICIVVDMWLTGFDIPCLDTMYVYKPMQGHTLMQAIARVNRVYKEKEGGLIVDYVGIATALRQAIKDYSDRDREHIGNNEIGEIALPKFKEKLEICSDLMHGVNISNFFEESNLERARCIANGIDHILGDEEKKKIFLKEATALRQAETLCRSLLNEKERILSAYFEAVRAGVSKVIGSGKLSVRDINKRINELLKASIKSDGVVNVFENIPEFSIFDKDYLEKIRQMDQKNLAASMLQKLLNDEINVYKRTNLVKSQLFSQKMEELMRKYRNALITNAEVIEELLKMAEEIRNTNKEGNELGLSNAEKAFYDAITKPENIKDFYTNKELKAMVQELTEELRKSRTIDWQLKDSARARMRSKVRRLLKRYGYPPENQKFALEYVIHQAELMSDNMDEYVIERPMPMAAEE